MKRPAILFALAALLLAGHLVTRFAGFADHTSALAGMPISASSWTLGPIHVALYLLVVGVAPVLVIGATLESVILLWRGQLGLSRRRG